MRTPQRVEYNAATMRYQGSDYRGRFAPTPSGPLHLGSLLTALASYLQARAQQGLWLLRIDDLDGPRVAPGAESVILRQLEWHGLLWDEAPRRQSKQVAEYEAALETLRTRGLTYACDCTRAMLSQQRVGGTGSEVYSGRCRQRQLDRDKRHAVRIRSDEATIEFSDGWQGAQRRQLKRDIGDFTLRRADGQISYQLACAVDEAAQRISEVVRGADLLDSTFRQLSLMKPLALHSPMYRHLAVLTDARGAKLSKQNHAPPLEIASASDNLFRCLQWLNQAPPASLRNAPAAELLSWAIQHWAPQEVSAQRLIPV